MPPLDVVLPSWTLNWPGFGHHGYDQCPVWDRLVEGPPAGACGGPAGGQGRSMPWVLAASRSSVSGFRSAYSRDLRCTFTLKITAYLFVVPPLVAAGPPPGPSPASHWNQPLCTAGIPSNPNNTLTLEFRI